MLLANLAGIAEAGAMKTLVARRRPNRRIAAKLSLKPAVFATHRVEGGFSVRTFCDAFGVTQESFTRLAGFSPRAVAHWVSGRTPSRSARQRFTELTRLFDALADMVDPKAIGEWLKAPNPAFEGSTPLQVIERGETDRIWRMLWELQSGNTG
jgi:DNA-binding transcriptional regulator YiaG